jgi:hypothetical protein
MVASIFPPEKLRKKIVLSLHNNNRVYCGA